MNAKGDPSTARKEGGDEQSFFFIFPLSSLQGCKQGFNIFWSSAFKMPLKTKIRANKHEKEKERESHG